MTILVPPNLHPLRGVSVLRQWRNLYEDQLQPLRSKVNKTNLSETPQILLGQRWLRKGITFNYISHDIGLTLSTKTEK